MGDQIIMFISQIFNGLKIGSVYSLVALATPWCTASFV